MRHTDQSTNSTISTPANSTCDHACYHVTMTKSSQEKQWHRNFYRQPQFLSTSIYYRQITRCKFTIMIVEYDQKRARLTHVTMTKSRQENGDIGISIDKPYFYRQSIYLAKNSVTRMIMIINRFTKEKFTTRNHFILRIYRRWSGMNRTPHSEFLSTGSISIDILGAIQIHDFFPTRI